MAKKIEWYQEFINKHYKPKKSDIKVLFHYEIAKGIKKEDAIGRVASESSSGTWTTLTVKPKLLSKTKAYAYKYNNNSLKIAYPLINFESGSVPDLMASIAGNVFGMKAVKKLRLIDAELPMEYVKKFKGPKYGQDVIKKIFKRKHGPITSMVPKPKLGFTSREHAEKVAYVAWQGGIDCVKDDENLTNQSFNKFNDRVRYMAKTRDKVMQETGEVKDAFMNVTAPDLKELEKRVKLLHDYGFNYFMIDVVIAGFGEVATAAKLAHDYNMAIHGHRAMHAAFTKNKHHGITMLFLAKLMRLLGVDQIHTGTLVGKLEGDKKEILAMKDMLTKKQVKEVKNVRMPQKWGKIKSTVPVSSGGLHPGILPKIFNLYGTSDIAIQVGGGIQGHPKGIEAGAKAVVQAIEAYKKGVTLGQYAKSHRELRQALKKWGHLEPV